MGHIQEERDNIPTGEHVKVGDEMRGQEPHSAPICMM
jgi:hypothetical protein